MLPCAMGRNDVSDLHLFFQSFSVINFEQDLPRWVRARAPKRLQNRLVYGARARTHLEFYFVFVNHSFVVWCCKQRFRMLPAVILRQTGL